MSSTIHVSLTCPSDARDLATYVAARGLTSEVTTVDDHCEIAIGYPATRLHDEFERALASWLEERERPLIPTETAHDEYVLHPPGD
jgi:hypothetical protein